ncbi:protein of unknown function [Methylacidimicrobium sp. AP8]|uniref:hypothetical protein n=1 Tax=Methylacidimicrobium sp. AP8 TaxID=2730359 RepID=UPI0018C0DD95|nr:hypothetical protein [Methylacidimicrobium sp. AP8]CAB4243914.1 protein of unknown function [Methylacidimicrobium sp. AP8]
MSPPSPSRGSIASARGSEPPPYAVRPPARTGEKSATTRERAKPKTPDLEEAGGGSKGRFGDVALALAAALISTLTAIYLALVYADVF